MSEPRPKQFQHIFWYSPEWKYFFMLSRGPSRTMKGCYCNTLNTQLMLKVHKIKNIVYHKESRSKMSVLDKPPSTKDTHAFLLLTVLKWHPWKNSRQMVTHTHLGCTEQLWGSPGCRAGELASASTCVPLAVPPSAEPATASTTLHPLQGHLGESTAPPHCPGASIRRLQAAPASPQSLPSHTAVLR